VFLHDAPGGGRLQEGMLGVVVRRRQAAGEDTVDLALPRVLPVWAQAVLLSLYGFVVAGVASYLSWQSGSGTSG